MWGMPRHVLQVRKLHPAFHPELHRVERIGWLRAAVLGANDGIVSTGSLVIGVAAAAAGRSEVLVAGVAGLVAGAMSMAAGEYVSVSSQSDAEHADLERERKELASAPDHELDELTGIYVGRGIDSELARQVAVQLMEHDAMGAHARDELGIVSVNAARPVQAGLASASSFAVGAALPLIVFTLAPGGDATWIVGASCLGALALLGAISARAGGSPPGKAIARVTFWGALAMVVTAGVGALFGA